MKADLESRKKWMNVLFSTGFILLFFFGYGWYNVTVHNLAGNKINFFTRNSSVKVSFGDPDAKVDSWETLIQVSDDPSSSEKFTGETRSCIIENNSKYDINDWTIRFNIQQNCYLNGFWCGDFEVHQFRNNSETIERINSNTVDVSKLSLENNKYSPNLMIHLVPGDYLVYYPSEKANENIIKNKASVGIGFIFYSQEVMNLFDFELSYKNNIKLIDTLHFKIYILLLIIYIFSLIFFHALFIMARKYNERTEYSMRSISVMAEIYSEVHILNLDSNSGYLIKGDSSKLLFNFLGTSITNCFAKYIEEDCVENYKEELKKFLDFKSISELFNDISSISCEYQSKKIGWVSLRLFKMDNKNKKLKQFIFAVQDINGEKLRKVQEQEIQNQKEYAKLIRGSFMNTVSFATAGIMNSMMETNKLLMDTAASEKEKALVTGVINSITHLSLLQNSIFDMFDLESNSFVLKNKQYNLKEVIDRLYEILAPFYTNKEYEVQKAIDSNIPETLEGDKDRIMQVLMLLMISSFVVTEKGYVKFSVFSKQKDDTVELLFSIRDTTMGFNEEMMNEVYSFLEGSKITSFENPSLVYLKIIDGILKNMGSALKISSCVGEGSEFYFTLKQKIIG